MDRPFPAYKGDEPYLFVSYAHKDASAVFPELTRLRDQGFNIWYDEGIEAGTEWREEIAHAIKRARLFLYFVTPDSVQSENCRKEVNFAVDEHTPIIAIHFKHTDLPDGLKLTLSDRQAIMRHEIPASEYQEKLQSRISSYLDPHAVQAATDKKRSKTPLFAAGLVAIFVIGLSLFFYNQRGDEVPIGTEKPEGASIAVLPFVNMSSDREQEYFSDGISEEILNVLSQIPNLHVTSRSSSFAFKGKDINLTEVANKLGVKNILEGSVRKSGNRIRITAQLITAGSDKHLWSQTFDRELTVDNIFEIQDEIAAAIVVALTAELGLDAKIAPREVVAVSLDAHNEYLKGRFFIERRTEKDVQTALTHFTKVTELAPDYAPGWMGVAWAHQYLSELQYGSVPMKISYQRAMPAIQKALQLDPELAEAYGVLGFIDGEDKEKAVAAFEKAIELNPNYTYAYVWMAGRLGADEPKRRMSLLQKAVKLDPMSLLANVNYAGMLSGFGRFEEAEQVIAHMKKIEPNSHMVFGAYSNLRRHQYRLGEATYYLSKRIEISANLLMRSNLAVQYVNLGLIQLGLDVIKDTYLEMLKHVLTGEVELLISDFRANLPRSESDGLGAFWRGYAEYLGENYAQAIKYFLMSGPLCTKCDYLIFSYLQLGDIESAKPLLEQRRKKHQTDVSAGLNGVFREINAIHLALLDADVSAALSILKGASEKGSVIDFKYGIEPLYKSLREHPDWPSLLAESNRHAAEQRENYLKLVAEEAGTIDTASAEIAE